MGFFKNKTNIFLSLILILLIGLGAFLGYRFFKEPPITSPDFSKMNEQEVISWANDNNVSDKLEIKHEYDDSIPEGFVIYQSIKEGDEISDSFLIIISDGPDLTNAIKIPEDIKTIEEFCNWANDNGFTDYVIEYNNESEDKEGTILSINPFIVKNGQKTKITISSNKNIDVPDFTYMSDKEASNWSKENNVKLNYVYETSTLPKDNFISQSVKAGEKVASGESIDIVISKGSETTKDEKTATIDETKYLGIKEEDFLKELKTLGFTNIVKIEEVKSSKYPKGTICYYLPDGKQKLDTKIEYKVSTGDEEPSEIKKATIDPYGYLGKSEETFVSELKKLGFTNVVKIGEVEKSIYPEDTICYYLPDGEQNLDTKIEYKIVKKKDTSSNKNTANIDPYDYLGKSEETFVSELKKLGFSNIVKIAEVEKSVYSEGTVCYYLPDGEQKLDTKIEYKIVKKKDSSTESKSVYIDPYDYLGKSEETFVSELKKLGFTNITKIGEIDSSKYSPDTIAYYLPDGNQKIDTKIEYKTVRKKDAPVTPTKPSDEYVNVPSVTSNPCGSNSSCSLNGLNYSIKYENSSSISKGSVINVTPAIGQSVKKNSTITVTISNGTNTKYIDKAESYRAACSTSTTVNDTKNYINDVLSGFDISFVTSSSRDYSEGKIISISVNGSTSYSPGDYPLNSKIVVTISSGYAQ